MKIIFIPYAAVTLPLDDYASNVRTVFSNLGYDITSIHTLNDPREGVQKADAIVIGGGNSFVLLHSLYAYGLLDLIREKVTAGTPYIGWSAGANMACPTLMTTNDMPIVFPPSFDALNLVPFQINPHYTELKLEGHGGETRQQRIEEFLVKNSHRKVIGLPEGMLFRREEERLRLGGSGTAKLFQYNEVPKAISAGEDVSELLG